MLQAFDEWLVAGYDGDSAQFNNSYSAAQQWNQYYPNEAAVAQLEWQCTPNCNSGNVYGMVVKHSQNGNYAIVEVNDLITELPASRNNSYLYLGQYNGHSYFRSRWTQNWWDSRDESIRDYGYLVVINDEDELKALEECYTMIGYYSEGSGTDQLCQATGNG